MIKKKPEGAPGQGLVYLNHHTVGGQKGGTERLEMGQKGETERQGQKSPNRKK